MTEPREDTEYADRLAEAISERLLPVVSRAVDRAQRTRGSYHDDGTCQVCAQVALAPLIDRDSWLQEPRFAAFRVAYAYACSQANAIGGLSKIDPEDTYHIWAALRRGEDRAAAVGGGGGG